MNKFTKLGFATLLLSLSSESHSKIMLFSPFASMHEMQMYAGFYGNDFKRHTTPTKSVMTDADKLVYFENISKERLSINYNRTLKERFNDFNFYEFLQYRLGHESLAPILINTYSNADPTYRAKMYAYFENDENFQSGFKRESIYTRVVDFIKAII